MNNKEEIYKLGFDAGVAFEKLNTVTPKTKSVSDGEKKKNYYKLLKRRLYAREYYRSKKEKSTGNPVEKRV